MEIENNKIERVGFGKRLLAFFIDLIISSILGFILSSFAGIMLLEFFFETSQVNETMATVESIQSGMGNTIKEIFIAISGIGAISFLIMIMEGITGQTPAKMLLGIINANQNGTRANTIVLSLRTFLKNISSIFSLIAVVLGISIIGTIGSFLGFIIFIGCFFVLGSNKESIHDMLAKTAVFNKSEIK